MLLQKKASLELLSTLDYITEHWLPVYQNVPDLTQDDGNQVMV